MEQICLPQLSMLDEKHSNQFTLEEAVKPVKGVQYGSVSQKSSLLTGNSDAEVSW